MAFVRLQDTGGSIEIVVFPKVFARTADVWLKDTVVVITGRADEKEDHMTILADDVLRIS